MLRQHVHHVPVTADHVRRYALDVTTLLPQASLSRFVGQAFIVDDWLEVPIGDGWLAAYRLAHVGPPEHPRTRILEVRVFPDEPDHTAGDWSAAVLGRAVTPAATAFSFERLRRGVTEKLFNAALSATRANAERHRALEAFGHPARRHQPAHEGRGAGRPRLPAMFYARLAVRYHAIEHHRRREPRMSTRTLLQQRYYPEASVAAIGKWLSTARRHGLLTKTERGGRGSMATMAARQLVDRRPT